MGAGISSSVSRQAYPNMMPWSPAPSSLLPRASTPSAMSLDWEWTCTSTALWRQWKPLLLVTDVLDAGPRRLLEMAMGDRGGTPDLARHHDAIGRGQRFDGHSRLGIGRHVHVHDRVGDAVANLVRMPFGHRLAGEQVVASRHGSPPRTWVPGPARSRAHAGPPGSPPLRRRRARLPQSKFLWRYSCGISGRAARAILLGSLSSHRQVV